MDERFSAMDEEGNNDDFLCVFSRSYKLFRPSAVLMLCRQFVHGQTSSDGPRTGAAAALGPQGRSLQAASSEILSRDEPVV